MAVAKSLNFSSQIFSKSATFQLLKFDRSLNLNASAATSQQLLGPAVKLLLFHYNLGAETVPKRTGPKKNILKSDVLGHIQAQKLAPVKRQPTPPVQPKLDLKTEVKAVVTGAPLIKPADGKQRRQTHVDIPLSNMRQTIAKRLSQSKSSIPHAYISAQIPVGNIQKLRTKLAEKVGLKLSLNDFIVKACAQALQSFPELNVQWKADSIQRQPSVDISVAVATPNGLITPIIFGADKLGVDAISQRLRELAGKARDGRLRPEEFQGGTFTISNLGMFGSVSSFTAIINPPQAAILAVGGLCPAGTHFGATLCYDARAIQQEDAQRFMNALQLMMAEPSALLGGLGVADDVVDLDADDFEEAGDGGFLDDEDERMLAKLL